MASRVCIFDAKAHIRAFLREELEESGFIIQQCSTAEELEALLARTPLDVLLLTVSEFAEQAVTALDITAEKSPQSAVLLIGSPRPALDAVFEHGQQRGLRCLPPLVTPYRIEDLRERLSEFTPASRPMDIAADVEEAARCGWLELWYEPKLDVQSLRIAGAEAILRMSHPNWGTVSPTDLYSGSGDPHMKSLATFTVRQTIADWNFFVENCAALDMAISLPFSFLEYDEAVEHLRGFLPQHPAFNALLVQIKASELTTAVESAAEAARRLRFHNVAVSIDLGDEGPAIAEFDSIPFSELKVGRRWISGCAKDRFRWSVCSMIVKLADRLGAKAAAKGIETHEDLRMARELGFQYAQGPLFRTPVRADRFVRQLIADGRRGRITV